MCLMDSFEMRNTPAIVFVVFCGGGNPLALLHHSDGSPIASEMLHRPFSTRADWSRNRGYLANTCLRRHLGPTKGGLHRRWSFPFQHPFLPACIGVHNWTAYRPGTQFG